MTENTDAIIVKNLTKIYRVKERKSLFKSIKKEIKALDNVTLQIKRGEIFGLLGPNGAGKTTLIKILTTLLLPTSGEVFIDGIPITQEHLVRHHIGAMLMGERGLYWKLTGRENLEYFGSLYYLSKKEIKERIKQLNELLELKDFIDRPVESYSSGQKMRMAFARALINDAPILLFDEPTATLDVHQARKVREIVKMLNKEEEKTILYSTHFMIEAEELCDCVAIIDLGKILKVGSPDDLKQEIQEKTIVSISGIFPPKIDEELLQLDDVTHVHLNAAATSTDTNHNGNSFPTLIIHGRKNSDLLPNVLKYLTTKGAKIYNVKDQQPTLEDVFVKLTGRTLKEDTSIKR